MVGLEWWVWNGGFRMVGSEWLFWNDWFGVGGL